MAAAPLSVPVSLNLNLSNINTNCCNGSDSLRGGCCANSNCCQTTLNLQNAKIVALGPNEVAVEPPPGCGTACADALYAMFCCCFPRAPAPANRFAEGKRLYEQSLVERLGGPSGKQVALNYVNMQDIGSKPELNAEDVTKLEQAVGNLQGNIENLNKMVTTLRLTAASDQAKVTDIPVQAVPPQHVVAATVLKRGKSENFQEAQLRDDLSKLPVDHPLTPAQINQIVHSVQGAILAKHAAQVDSAFIRLVVAKQLDHFGVQIVPAGIQGSPPKDLLVAIQDKNLESLNSQELQSLLACIGPNVLRAPSGPLSASSQPQAPLGDVAPSLLLKAPQGPVAGGPRPPAHQRPPARGSHPQAPQGAAPASQPLQVQPAPEVGSAQSQAQQGAAPSSLPLQVQPVPEVGSVQPQAPQDVVAASLPLQAPTAIATPSLTAQAPAASEISSLLPSEVPAAGSST